MAAWMTRAEKTRLSEALQSRTVRVPAAVLAALSQQPRSETRARQSTPQDDRSCMDCSCADCLDCLDCLYDLLRACAALLKLLLVPVGIGIVIFVLVQAASPRSGGSHATQVPDMCNPDVEACG